MDSPSPAKCRLAILVPAAAPNSWFIYLAYSRFEIAKMELGAEYCLARLTLLESVLGRRPAEPALLLTLLPMTQYRSVSSGSIAMV